MARPGRGAIEEAYIEVLADTKNFPESLKRGVQRSLDDVVRLAKDKFDEFEKIAEDAGDDTYKALAQTARRVGIAFDSTDNSIEGITGSLMEFSGDLRKLGPEGARAIKTLENAIKRLDDQGFLAISDALRRVDDDAERFGKSIRASLGRAAVAGIDDLERSIEDLADTGSREMDVLQQSIRAALDNLGDAEDLERLENHFREAARAIEEDFEDALIESYNQLRRLRDQGELTGDQMRDAMAEVARTLDSDMAEAINDVIRDLRLVSGESQAFREISDEARRAANEINDLVDRARQLEGFDPQLEEDFIQGRLSVERFTAEVTRAEEAVEQVGDQARRTGTEMRVFGNRGNDAFGSLVASANRFRFVMLDLRFLAGAVGLFLAQRFASFGLEAASSIEQARLSFQVLARSIEGDLTKSFDEFDSAAETSLSRVIEFARETPFSLEEVTDAVRRLNAFLPSFGIASEEALSTLAGRTEISIELFEDMGAALSVLGNQESLPKLVKALGDVGARGKLTAEEVRQFANALPGLEIRTSIITGIFDPMVQTSDQILALREEFGRLGADAEQAPQEALAAFVDFQRRGLITTDVVVEGLRASFRNLAGDDALEAFTMTIDGVIEKLKEAAEVGSSRGFSELAPELVAGVLPSLELVEQASEDFALALTDLAITSVPFALRAFQDLTRVGMAFFDELTEFIVDNTEVIDDALASFPAFAEEGMEALFDLFDALAPLIPVALDAATAFASGLGASLRALAPFIEVVADGLDAMPDSLLALLFLVPKVTGVMKGLKVAADAAVAAQASAVAAGESLQGIARFAGAARIGMLGLNTALVGFAAGTLIMAKVERDFERGRDAANEFIDEVTQLDGIDSMEQLAARTRINMDVIRQEFELTREELERKISDNLVTDDGFLGDIARGFSSFFGSEDLATDFEIGVRTVLDPTIGEDLAALEEYAAAHEDLQMAVEGSSVVVGGFRVETSNIDRALGRARLSLIATTDEFDKGSLAAALTKDVMEDLAFASGLTADEILELAQEGVGPLEDALFDAIAADLPTFLADVGAQADRLDLDQIIDQAADTETAFRNAANEVKGLTDALRAQVDPVFAVVDAERNLEESKRAQERAVADLATAQRELSELQADPEATTSQIETAQRAVEDANVAIEDSYFGVRDAVLDVVSATGNLAESAANPEINASVAGTIEQFEALLGLIDDPELEAELFDIMVEGLEGVPGITEDVILSLGQTEGAAKTAADGIADSANYAKDEFDKAASGFRDGLVKVVDAGAVSDYKFGEAMDSIEAGAADAMDSTTNEFIVGRQNILNETDTIGGAGQTLREEFQRGMAGLPGYLRNIGIEAEDSFLNQFSFFDARSRGERFADAFVGGVRGGLQATSPSKKMIQAAEDAVAGIRIGINRNLSTVSAAGNAVADALVGPIDTSRISPVRPSVAPPRQPAAVTGPSAALSIGTIVSARPVEVAQRVVGAFDDYMYLNEPGLQP